MSGAPDPTPISPGAQRALDVLKARLEKAIKNQGEATKKLADLESDPKSTDAQKEEAKKAVENAVKEIETIQKSIADTEGTVKKPIPESEKTTSKNAPERINNFGSKVDTLFENAKSMVGPYPESTKKINNDHEPVIEENQGLIDKFLKSKFPCDREQSRRGVKVAEEILGNHSDVVDLKPDLICKLAEEPDICKTDRGVILDSRCAVHQIVLSQSISSIEKSVREDIKKATEEYKKKTGLSIGPVMPTALKSSLLEGKQSKLTQELKKAKAKARAKTTQTTETTTESTQTTESKPQSMQSIKKYDTEPDDWNGTGDPNFLTFTLDSSQNKFYSEYNDGKKFYRIYGDDPEIIINLFSKHFAASHGMPDHLVFQIDMENGKLYAANPNDKSILIYGNSPEEIVAKFNGSLEDDNKDENEDKNEDENEDKNKDDTSVPEKALFSRKNPKPFIKYISYFLKEAIKDSKEGMEYAKNNPSKKESMFSKKIKIDPELIKKYTQITNDIQILNEAFQQTQDVENYNFARDDEIDSAFTLATDSIKESIYSTEQVLTKGTSVANMAFTSALKTEEKIIALIKIIDNGLEKSTLTATEAKAAEAKAAEAKAAEAKAAEAKAAEAKAAEVKAAEAKAEAEVKAAEAKAAEAKAAEAKAAEAKAAEVKAAEAKAAEAKAAEAKAAEAKAEAETEAAKAKAATPASANEDTILIDNFINEINPILETNHQSYPSPKTERSIIEQYKDNISNSTLLYNTTIGKFFTKLSEFDLKKFKPGKIDQLNKYYDNFRTELSDRGKKSDFITGEMRTVKNDERISDERYTAIKALLPTFKIERNKIINSRGPLSNLLRKSPTSK